MIVAYLIMLHHKFEQFRYLFEAVYSPGDLFLIHIDRSSPPAFHHLVRTYAGRHGNVAFLSPRRVAWGAWSLIAPELRAIEFFLRTDQDWSYFINLSGQDYPIKSRDVIRDTLNSAWPKNFVGVTRFADIEISEPDDPHLKRRLIIDLFGRRRFVTPFHLPPSKSVNMDFKGSNWHILSRDFCRWLINAPIRRKIERYLRFTSSPSEVFIQAMIMNSPFANMRMEHSGHEVIWPGPKVLDSADYDRLIQSPALFARKFDQGRDSEILRRLAKVNGYVTPRPLEALPSSWPG